MPISTSFEKIRGMFDVVQNHHHVKLAIVRLSVALLWKQTRTKIWSSRLASPCCYIVKMVLILCCLLTQSYLFIVTRKGKVPLLSVTLWNPTAKAVRGIEAWKDDIWCFSPDFDSLRVSVCLWRWREGCVCQQTWHKGTGEGLSVAAMVQIRRFQLISRQNPWSKITKGLTFWKVN